MYSFIKKIFYNNKKHYKLVFSLILFIIIIVTIYLLINFFNRVKEGNTPINTENNAEQTPEMTTAYDTTTTFYDPTVKDKIKDITTIIDEKEIENKEKLAKLNILIADIETDINRIIDRDEGLRDLINTNDE